MANVCVPGHLLRKQCLDPFQVVSGTPTSEQQRYVLLLLYRTFQMQFIPSHVCLMFYSVPINLFLAQCMIDKYQMN